MGIELKNPVVVGACSMSKRLDTIKKIEAAGAGALVIKSLFEEQVQLERDKFARDLTTYDEQIAEAITFFPKLEHAGPKEHLFWVKEAKKSVKMPVIASLNAIHEDVWVEYAGRLADTGVDGLELNFYSIPLDSSLSSSDLEKQELEAFAKVRESVKIPIAVKLHPYYSNLLHVASSFDRLGANAVVLFNRFFQPDIHVEKEQERASVMWSDSRDSLVSLRWTALLYGRIKADISSSTGILTGEDALKMILAGAATVQVVSTLYKNGIPVIGRLLKDIEGWMEGKGYKTLQDFRGKVSKQNVKHPWAFERGQYIKLLLGFD
jgi:dihydroorotate dehydrogenase (fumarate)